MSADAKRIQAKNRRYCALQKLVETTDYFSEEEMQRRNPILYDQLIGRFQSKEEKEEFLKRSYQMTASSKTPLADLLMAHMNRNEDGESCRRLDQEQQKADEDEADAEYLEQDSDDEMDDTDARGKNVARDQEDCVEEIDDDEKEVFKKEFFMTMYEIFLEGKEADFDYSTVDDNEEYDIGENVEQDAEEKYFDDEEPCDSNMDQ